MDVIMTSDKASQSGSEKWNYKILEPNSRVLRGEKKKGRVRVGGLQAPESRARRQRAPVIGGGPFKAEGRGLQDFLFQRQQVGGTCAGRAAVVAFWSFVSGGGVARAETGGVRAERDVGDASPSIQLSRV